MSLPADGARGSRRDVLSTVALVVGLLRDVVLIALVVGLMVVGGRIASAVGDAADTDPAPGVTVPAGQVPCDDPATDEWGTFCPGTPGD